MADYCKSPRILCMCGMDLGYRVAGFILESGLDCAFIVNGKEVTGQWYRTPRELDINEMDWRDVKSWNPDLILTAFFHKILPPDIFELPVLGAWNIHLGDTERYRGAYPSIRALINGDELRVTLHRIDRDIDTGDILAKLSFAVPRGSTGRDLYDLMTEKGYELFLQCWNDLTSGVALNSTRRQNGRGAELMYKSELEHRLYPPEAFSRAVRALTFPPFPPPYFVSEGGNSSLPRTQPGMVSSSPQTSAILKTRGVKKKMNNNGIYDGFNEGAGKRAEIIRSSVFTVLCLLLSGTSAASDYATISYMPSEDLEEFIVERLDLTTFRNSLGPARSPGMRYFSDMGLIPTEISEGRIVFETESWYYCIELVERRDVNHDGIEDLQICFTDDSIHGTYYVKYIYLLTCLSDDSDLIAIAYGPSGYHYSERDPEMTEEIVTPWSEQGSAETDEE